MLLSFEHRLGNQAPRRKRGRSLYRGEETGGFRAVVRPVAASCCQAANPCCYCARGRGGGTWMRGAGHHRRRRRGDAAGRRRSRSHRPQADVPVACRRSRAGWIPTFGSSMGMRPESQVRNAAPSAARQTGEKLYCLTGDRGAPADQPPGRFVADSPLERAGFELPVPCPWTSSVVAGALWTC